MKPAMPSSVRGLRLEYGTELYTPIFIWVPKLDAKGEENYKENYDKAKNKYSTYTRFNVEKIDTNEDKVIKQISIINDKGKRVFVHAEKKQGGNKND